ncbi:MAG: cytochrome c oxidase assembly protein [Chloroflexota bacterium]|nr:cytochrome c oxidase assembly protein [Chloroflexota bacterium]
MISGQMALVVKAWRREQHSRPWLDAALAMLLLAASSVPASAHTDVRPTPDTIWTAWRPDPLFALLLLVAVWIYLRGVARMWARGGDGQGVRRWQLGAYLGGIATFALSRLTPLDAMGGSLFSAHMTQHLLVILVGPLLIAAGRPGLAILWALPIQWRRRVTRLPKESRWVAAVWDGLNHWASVLVLFAGVLWLWHVPALYDAALESQLVHDLEHATFAAMAVLFWRRVLEAGRPTGMGHAAAFLLIFATALHSSALGALLTFARKPLYVSHMAYTDDWGLTPLEDQQLAGVIMWVPMGLWFTVTALILIGRWIVAAGESVQRLERAETDFETATEHTVATGRS